MGHLQQPVQIREDNKEVLYVAKGEGKHSKRWHINIKYHLAQKYLDELYYLDDVRGHTNDADIFTKPTLTDEQFYAYRDGMLTKLYTWLSPRQGGVLGLTSTSTPQYLVPTGTSTHSHNA